MYSKIKERKEKDNPKEKMTTPVTVDWRHIQWLTSEFSFYGLIFTLFFVFYFSLGGNKSMVSTCLKKKKNMFEKGK
jgi:hypothetical protein